jgi:hypothetical protein
LEKQKKEKPFVFASAFAEKDDRWGEIKSNIRLDPSMDQDKVDQLW